MSEATVTLGDSGTSAPGHADRNVAGLDRWILSEGPRHEDVASFVAALAPRLRDAGLPVYRMTTGIPMLHPVVRAETVVWVDGHDVELRRHLANLKSDEDLKRSPMYGVYYRGETVRVPIPAEPTANEYGIVEDLRRDGATDYIAFPVPAGRGYNSLTVATRRAGGFDGGMADFVAALLPSIGIVLELHTQRRTAETLLDTYIGHRTAARVLSGEIRRGDGQSIDAVIFFSDLRGFTEITARFPSREVVDILNFYFESVTKPVAAEGGEVLKFIGDAVLAIFPYGSDDQARSAAERALMAARQAQLNLTDFCTTCYGDRLPRLSVGISLDAGEVFYGNVGGPERLDFTVVGDAVNIGSRMSALCRDLDHPVLVSSRIAGLTERPLQSAGHHVLKGVNEPQEVFYPVQCDRILREAELARRIAAE